MQSAVTGDAGIEILEVAFDPGLVASAPRAVICKMTLEHIAQPVAMLRQIAELARRSTDCEIFVQVPNAGAIFSLGAFWDIYYEHCNYFTARTLNYAFQCAGLEPVTIVPVFANQYIVAHAKLAPGPHDLARAGDTASDLESFQQFCRNADRQAKKWRESIHGWISTSEQIMLWGGGSKAVAFISFTKSAEHLLAAIDINPRKWKTYLPGSCLPVLSPNQAKTSELTRIILLNRAYHDEVQRECSRVGIEALIVAVEGSVQDPP